MYIIHAQDVLEDENYIQNDSLFIFNSTNEL